MSLGEAKIRYEKEVSIDDVVNEANQIHQKCKKLWPANDDSTALAKIHDDMVSDHRQFADAYPIVLRYMCELKQYRQKAFRRYLNYVKNHPWNSEDSYFESQAMYVTILFKETHPRYDEQKARKLFDNTVRMLKLERDAFKQQMDANKKEVDRDHARMMKKNTLELKEWFARYGKECIDVPVRAVCLDENANAECDALHRVDDLINAAAADSDLDECAF